MGEARSDTSGTLLVSAATSLGAAIEEIAAAFELRQGDVSVSVNLAGSGALATQIELGAPVDVLATADEASMQTVVDGVGTIGDPVIFTANEPQILVGPGNPFGVTALADLAAPGLVYVQADEAAAIGRYTAEILERAGVTLAPRSFEESALSAANKVVLGEADAAIVFATDVLAVGDAGEGVEIPPEINVVARYPIAVPSSAPDPVTAAAFVEFVLGDEGQSILASHGFIRP